MKRPRPSSCSRLGPTAHSAHMLNRMSKKPRPPIPPPAGGRNADVISRYHWPEAMPCSGPPALNRAYPSSAQSLAMDGRASSIRNSRTLTAIRVQVTTAVRAGRPPKTVVGRRVVRLPSCTQSTHCCPTAAERRQSGQA